MKKIFLGYFTKAYLKYPTLGGCIAGYVLTKSSAWMIAPDVFIRPSIAFLYLAAVVVPYPFVFLLPFVSMIGSTHPLQVFISVFVGSQVCFFVSRILKWRGNKQSRVTAMVIATFMAQLATTIFRSVTQIQPFFSYLPDGMVKAALAIPPILVIGLGGLWVMEYLGVISFGRISESYGVAKRLAPVFSRFKR